MNIILSSRDNQNSIDLKNKIKKMNTASKVMLAGRTDNIEIIKILSSDGHIDVRKGTAYNINTPAEILSILSNDKDKNVREFCYANNNIDIKDLYNRASKETDIGATFYILRSDKCDEKIIDIIYKRFKSDSDILKAIAGNKNSNKNLLIQIYDDKKSTSNGILFRLCANVNLPLNILEEIYKNYSNVEGVYNNLASNYNTPKNILTKIFSTIKKVSNFNGSQFHGLQYLCRNKNMPTEILRNIVKSNSYKNFYDDIAMNENLPKDIINYLIKYSLKDGVFDSIKNGVLIFLLDNTCVDFQTKMKIINHKNFLQQVHDLDSIKDGTLRNYIDKKLTQNLKDQQKFQTPEKDTNMNYDKVNNGEGLYRLLEKRQELQYKYDYLQNLYNTKSLSQYKMPSSYDMTQSKLKPIKFILSKVNSNLIAYMLKVIIDWRKSRLNTRDAREKEMLINENLIEKLTKAEKSNDVELQRIVIEMALNTIHSSGQMIEHYGLDEHRLDYLSDMDTSRWDRELLHMASISKRDIVLYASNKLQVLDENSEPVFIEDTVEWVGGNGSYFNNGDLSKVVKIYDGENYIDVEIITSTARNSSIGKISFQWNANQFIKVSPPKSHEYSPVQMTGRYRTIGD